MKRVLVTGATGFLGRTLVPRLVAAGWTVTAHGRHAGAAVAGGELVHGDLADPAVAGGELVHGDLAEPASAEAVLAPWRWEAVIHLAGPVSGGSEDWATGVAVVHAHVRIALHVRRFAPAATRIVHASSMTVYGDPETTPVREDHPRRPRHLYGLAKALAEDVWLAEPALDAWILRLPGLFSEQRRAGALFHFCRAARAGEPVRVSTPTPTPWDVLHVDDAATAMVAALAAPERAGGPINVSYGAPVELGAIAAWIAQHAGAGSGVEQPAGVIHPVLQLDIARARALLGWAPASLHARLAALFAAYATEAV